MEDELEKRRIIKNIDKITGRDEKLKELPIYILKDLLKILT